MKIECGIEYGGAVLLYTLLLELELSVYNIFERDNRDIEIVTDGVKNIIYPRNVHVPGAS